MVSRITGKKSEDIEKIVRRLGPSFLTLHKPGVFAETGIKDIDRFLQWPKITFNVLSYAEKNMTRGPKDELAFLVAKYCYDNKKDVMLVLNPARDTRVDTLGSYYDALLTASYFYPGMGVVEFAHSDKTDRKGAIIPYVDVESINLGVKDSRERASILIDTKQYQTSKRLKEIFRNCIEGKKVNGDPLNSLYLSEDTEKLRKYLKKEKVQDLSNCIDVTNPDEFMSAQKAYHYKEDVLEKMKKMHIIFSSGGTLVRVLGQVEQLGPTYDENNTQIGPIYVVMTTSGNSAAINQHWHSNSGRNRTDDGNFSDKDGKPIWNPAKREVITKYGLNGKYDIRVMVVDKIDMRYGIGVAGILREDHETFKDIRPSKTGSMAFSALSERNCNLLEGGIVFPDLLSYTKDTGDVYLRKDPLVLPTNDPLNICVVSTDSSDLRYLMGMIKDNAKKG